MATPSGAPVRFPNARAFRAWLRQHHASESEVVLQLAKHHVAHTGVTYAEALDEALCYGWIDGIRRAFDADSFTQRFTPRRPKSMWSTLNVGHVRRLIAAKRMTKAGLAEFAKRDESRVYSHERPAAQLRPGEARLLRRHAAAWTTFQAETPSYRRRCASWVANAKREDTRARRLAVLIECSAKGVRIPPMRRPE